MQKDEILKEICLSNGISYSKLKQEAICCLTLELFYTGFSRIEGLENFQNLQYLYIIGQPIEQVDGLQHVTRLKTLCVAECKLKTTNGLNGLKLLSRLILYSNEIREVTNLDDLKLLQVLHLNNNLISSCSNFPNLPSLTELNLAENNIKQIGECLNHLDKLEILQLSGNKLSSLLDITSLSKLKHLKNLGINCPIYQNSKIAKLNYYFFYILYHLPNLNKLDDFDVSSTIIKEFIQTLVNKKKCFYNMKRRFILRNCDLITQKLNDLLKIMHIYSCIIISKLIKIDSESSVDSIEKIKINFDKTAKIIHKLEKERHLKAEEEISLLQLELESVGNIQIIEGNTLHNWYSAVEKLINSRFCLSSDHQNLKIKSVNIKKIFKIEIKSKRNDLNELVDCLSYEDDNDLLWSLDKQSNMNKNYDYLFHMNPTNLSLFAFLVQTLNSQIKEEKNSMVHLTNSLFHSTNQNLYEVLISKVYIGKSAGCLNSEDVFRLNSDSENDNVINSYYSNCTFQNNEMNCTCTKLQLEWFIPDSRYILPEYFVQYEYVYEDEANENSFFKLLNQLIDNPEDDIFSSSTLWPSIQYQILQDIKDIGNIKNGLNDSYNFNTNNNVEPENYHDHFRIHVEEDVNRDENTVQKIYFDIGDINLEAYNLEEFNKILTIPQQIESDVKVNITYDPYKSLQLFGRRDDVPINNLSMHLISQNIHNFSLLKLTASDKLNNIKSICLENAGLNDLLCMNQLLHLKWASFNGNCLKNLDGISSCILLEELSAENNKIANIDGVANLINLQSLYLSHNRISDINLNNFSQLKKLWLVSIESNKVQSLAPFMKLSFLNELYASSNCIIGPREVYYLKHLPKLSVFDLEGNPLKKSIEHLRLFVIYHLKNLKIFNAEVIHPNECIKAKEMFGGKLNENFLAENNPDTDFSKLTCLDLPQSSLQIVDFLNVDLFSNLLCINLERNNLTSFGNLIYLQNLKVLCLNHNKIESLFPKFKNKKIESLTTQVSLNIPTNILPKLEVLHLGYNGLKEISPLQLNKIKSLKAIFLQGNFISRLDGMIELSCLQQLVVDRNKIKEISEYCFHEDNVIVELHMEENRLKYIGQLANLSKLKRLFLASNKIQDLNELYKLENLESLEEISLLNNPVTKKNAHRYALIMTLEFLSIIDSVVVTEEERCRVQAVNQDQNNASSPILNPTNEVIAVRSNGNNCVSFSNIILVPPMSADQDFYKHQGGKMKPQNDLLIQPNKQPFSSVALPQSKNANFMQFTKYGKR